MIYLILCLFIIILAYLEALSMSSKLSQYGPFSKFIKKHCLGRLMIIPRMRRFETLVDLSDLKRAMTALEAYLKTIDIQINKELSKIE